MVKKWHKESCLKFILCSLSGALLLNQFVTSSSEKSCFAFWGFLFSQLFLNIVDSADPNQLTEPIYEPSDLILLCSQVVFTKCFSTEKLDVFSATMHCSNLCLYMFSTFSDMSQLNFARKFCVSANSPTWRTFKYTLATIFSAIYARNKN